MYRDRHLAVLPALKSPPIKSEGIITCKTHFDIAQGSNSDEKRVECRRNPETKLTLIRSISLTAMKLILYSKPDCHLCEGLQEKLEQISDLPLTLEVRDITTREDWWQAYQYEVPVMLVETASNQPIPLPRPSPRASVKQLTQMLQNYSQ